METPPPKKDLEVVPFTVQVTRGLLRDERSRRKTMGITTFVAVVMLVAGLSVLRPWLDLHEHPWRFVFYWFICAWETVLVVLLAVLDMLLIRAQARAARRAIEEQYSGRETPDSADPHGGE